MPNKIPFTGHKSSGRNYDSMRVFSTRGYGIQDRVREVALVVPCVRRGLFIVSDKWHVIMLLDV